MAAAIIEPVNSTPSQSGTTTPVDRLLLEVADVVNTSLDLDTTLRRVAEVIRKSDHHHSSEGITQEEALAWRKSMSMLAGVSISPTGGKHDR